MKKTLILALAAALFAAPSAFAAKKKDKKADAAHQAMMAKWTEYSTPSGGHRVLDAMVGTWDASMQMWMAPGVTPETSTGTSRISWINGGRTLEQVFQGSAMGQPYEGRGLVVYDNFKKGYESAWTDNMGTGMMKMTGRYDAAAKTLTDTGEGLDCHTWTLKPMRTVTTFVDPGHMTFEMYTPGPDGKEFVGLKITYTKKP